MKTEMFCFLKVNKKEVRVTIMTPDGDCYRSLKFVVGQMLFILICIFARFLGK